MLVTPIKTPVVHVKDNLWDLLESCITKILEKSILVVTSKIVSLCENSVVDKKDGSKEEKQDLVRANAEHYIEADVSRYNIMITIKDQVVAVNAGIDESNADNTYVLLPKNSYQTAEQIWSFLKQKFGVKDFGVIISDSKTFPLKWGTIGTCLGHCGFRALNDRIGEKDLFGHIMQMTKVNVAEALAVAAVLEMGEVAESQPLCLIESVNMVSFQNNPPTAGEIDELSISLEDDAYAPILTKADWKKGGFYQD
jgi:F420-0:gamma-glutamyl ligase